MRKLLGLLFSLFLLSGNFVFAQAAEKTVSNDFVFEVPRMDMVKTLPEFKNLIKRYSSIEFAGFCESRSLVMLKMPAENLAMVLKALESMHLTYYVKENATIAQAISTCANKEEIELSKASN